MRFPYKNLFNFFLNHIDGQAKTITSAAIILSAMSVLSGILGLFRDRLLAATFGAGDELDVYYAAFRLPDLIYSLLIFGALSGGFIPIFTSYLKKVDHYGYEANEEAWCLVNNFLNIFLTALLVLCIILAIFAPGIVVLLTPGFPPEKMALTVKLTRIIFLETFLLGISGIFGSILQSFKRFLIFSLAPVAYNLGIIFGILFLAKKWGITGVAMGVVLGAFLHMLVQLPSIFSLGCRYKMIFDFFHQGLLKILKLMGPRAFSLGIGQLNYLAITAIASGLAVGSLAVFNLSYNIITLPIGIIGSSFAVAAFPTFCEAFHNKDWQKFKENFSSAFRQILFLVVPITFFLIVLRAQIIRVILGAGKFGWHDTILTIEALQFFSFYLLFNSLTLLLIRALLAVENSWLPCLALLIGSSIRIGSALFLSQSLGVGGLALGFSLGSLVDMLFLWLFLKKQIKEYLDEVQIIISGLKILFASLVASLGVYLTLHLVALIVNMHTGFGILVQGLAAGLAGIYIYIGLGLLVKSREMIIFWDSLRHRLPWKKVIPEPIDMINKKEI